MVDWTSEEKKIEAFLLPSYSSFLFVSFFCCFVFAVVVIVCVCVCLVFLVLLLLFLSFFFFPSAFPLTLFTNGVGVVGDPDTTAVTGALSSALVGEDVAS